MSGAKQVLGHRLHLLHQQQVLRYLKRSPQLQVYKAFENTVSRLLQKLILYCKFVTRGPKRPTLGSEEGPDHTPGLGAKRKQDREPFLERSRVPVHPEHGSHPTPHELGQDALEEDVIYRLR
jgi:hypothetical protein